MIYQGKDLINLFCVLANFIFTLLSKNEYKKGNIMQITKVSFMNFNGLKNVAAMDVKSAVKPAEDMISSEKFSQKFFSGTALTGKIKNESADEYVKQYAENRKVMQEMKRTKEKDVAENYFAPFVPISENMIK